MKFLIVEDQPMVATLLKRYLQPIAEEIECVESLAGALDMLEADKSIDIVTLDLNLEDSNEQKTLLHLKDLRKWNSDLVIIVVTGVLSMKDAERVFRAGADGFMEKASVSMHSRSFLANLSEVAASIIANPRRYQRNVAFLEVICAKIGKYLSTSPA